MPLTLNTLNSYADHVGPHGLRPKDFDRVEKNLRAGIVRQRERRERRPARVSRSALRRRSLHDEPRGGARTFAGAENLLLAGIGGSALGPSAIFQALAHPLHNLLPLSKRAAGGPAF